MLGFAPKGTTCFLVHQETFQLFLNSGKKVSTPEHMQQSLAKGDDKKKEKKKQGVR